MDIRLLSATTAVATPARSTFLKRTDRAMSNDLPPDVLQTLRDMGIPDDEIEHVLSRPGATEEFVKRCRERVRQLSQGEGSLNHSAPDIAADIRNGKRLIEEEARLKAIPLVATDPRILIRAFHGMRAREDRAETNSQKIREYVGCNHNLSQTPLDQLAQSMSHQIGTSPQFNRHLLHSRSLSHAAPFSS